ncbi:hypothetical protein D6D24_06861 [Aureobasidium pullulans]|uniref:Uncharacterized protein n=1 Tax=Aureobasidium pullulans TaxID=5580 RepID=A0A4S8VKH3_AURPU|nr:hypothetical protein D6D24_06861 [Aureobasidium pullulans]
MSDQQNNQDLTMSKNKAGKQPFQDAAQPDNRPLSLGYSIEGLAKPGDFEHTDMFPGINLNHNIEKGYKQNFDDMIDMFGKGQALEAENVAHMLLTRGDLPVLYRTHAHVILAYGPVDCLFHARKAVEEAERGMNKFGDDEGVGTELLAVANRGLADVRTNAANTTNSTDAEKEDGEKKKPKQKGEKHTVGQCKTPFTKKARHEGRGLDDIDADQAEWRCGQPVKEKGPWNHGLWRWNTRADSSINSLWDAETILRLGNLRDEIEHEFNDGEPCPDFWSRACLSVLMDERFDRMRIFCNRHGITVDSDEGLLAEFIYQLCTDDDTYNEFLDLPMTIWIRHPLRFSVAHKHHDKSMATGWPTKPAKLSDRVEANNNLLFETWTSNVAKFDMTKEACDAFRDDLANVKLRRPELYKPTLDPDVKVVRTRDRKVEFHDLTVDDLAFDGIGLTFEVIKQADDEDEE